MAGYPPLISAAPSGISQASSITQDSAAPSAILRMAMSGHSPGGIARTAAATVLGSSPPPSSPVTEIAAFRGAIAADTT